MLRDNLTYVARPLFVDQSRIKGGRQITAPLAIAHRDDLSEADFLAQIFCVGNRRSRIIEGISPMDAIIHERLTCVHYLSCKQSPKYVINVFSIGVMRKWTENIEEAAVISGTSSGDRSASEWILPASAMTIDAAGQIRGP